MAIVLAQHQYAVLLVDIYSVEKWVGFKKPTPNLRTLSCIE